MSRSSAPSHSARRRPNAPRVFTSMAVVVGGVLGVVDDAAPTGFGGVDAVWRFVGGAMIVLCAGAAPVLALAVSAAVGAAASTEPALLFAGGVGLLAAVAASRRFDDAEWPRVLVGLAACFVAFNLPHDRFTGISTVVAAGVVAPLVVGAIGWGPRWLARFVVAVGGLVVVGATIAGVGGGLALAGARTDLEDARDLLEDAADEISGGNTGEAEDAIVEAVGALRAAENRLGGTWARSAGGVPVVAQHVEAVRAVATHGAATVSAALEAVQALDGDALAVNDGRIDLEAIVALAPSVERLRDASIAAESAVAKLDRTWLVSALTSELDEVAERLADVSGGARRAGDAVEVAPAMLGQSGLRRYVVLFVTPAEQRGSVGLIGNWALLEADDGQLSLAEVGRAEDLNIALEGSPFRLSGPDAYVERYGANNIENTAQDLTLSPHFPDVAKATAELFSEAKGVPIDGVGLIDPAGVAALLEVTGPVEVEGRRINAAEAREFLLLGQYLEFETDVERIAFLAELLRSTFSRFLESDVADPWNLDEVFGDVVAEGRLLISSVHPEDELRLDALGLTGAFPRRTGDSEDLFAVVTQNAGENKIDAFLDRSISYSVAVEPSTGVLTAQAVVELTNTLDDLSLPASVVGPPDQDFPVGTNRTVLTVYSPHRLLSVRVDGQDVGVQSLREFGVRSFGRQVDIAAGETVRIEFELRGRLVGADSYRLILPVQPGARDDEITVVLDEGSPGPRTATFVGAEDLVIELPFGEAGR